jgi:hypothetical protein
MLPHFKSVFTSVTTNLFIIYVVSAYCQVNLSNLLVRFDLIKFLNASQQWIYPCYNYTNYK